MSFETIDLGIPIMKSLLLILLSSTLALADLTNEQIKTAFATNSLTLTEDRLGTVREEVLTAHKDRCAVQPKESSKTRFAAIEIATKLGMNPVVDQSALTRITGAIESLPCESPCKRDCLTPSPAWSEYYDKTINLTSDAKTTKLFTDKGYSPVKISWEDIGRYQNSVWGDRISDVGIWVRKTESDPASAQLALSVRRDANFRDKVLMVSTDKIKVHLKERGETKEVTLRERLKALGLISKNRDDNAIVSNQFAIVPVPAKSMTTTSEHPPRAAFTFSIFPYGSTNFVITDVIEGSSDAIVGPGTHQLLFSNVDGKRAPFTASRAEDRKDLLEMEAALKSKGMDVDVQRYYLIQIPLQKEATGIELSNMGTPPMTYMYNGGGDFEGSMPVPMAASSVDSLFKNKMEKRDGERKEGLGKVAIGHGETEGAYNLGSGFSGKRSEEPVRVTVVYFVTPIGEVTEKDTEKFAQTFAGWDKEAIWGGSFVTGEQ